MTRKPASILGRRQFLLASAAIAAPLPLVTGAETGGGVSLRPSEDNDLFRVRIEMEVEGNVNLPDNPLVSRKRTQRLPLTSKATFDYEERLRLPEGAESGSPVTAAERYYHEAASESRVNRGDFTSRLRPSVREVVVRRDQLPETIYAVDDYFRHEELELLRIPASSVAVDQLLPQEGVEVGATYRPSAAVMASVLNLSSVETSDMQLEVMSITEASAKLQLQGKVDGSVDGVPTVIRAIGKLTFDRILGTTTWFAMVLHETREIGRAEPGFDVKATIKMIRKPLDSVSGLASRPRPLQITSPVPADRLFVDLRSEGIGFGVLMDRRWKMMRDVSGAAMMRMTDNDRSIGQCDFRPLASLPAGKQWTLEAFQQDVRRTLGEQLTDLIEADQRVSEGGVRVLRVAAQGAVQGVPIHWVLLHFSDDTGRRLLATFTLESDNVDEFAGSDLQLASSLRLIDPATAGAASGDEAATIGPADRPDASTARLERQDDNARLDAEIEVQSFSDAR